MIPQGLTGPQKVVQRRAHQQLPALRAVASAAFAATAHTHPPRVGVRPPASLHLTIAEATAVPSSVTAFHAAAAASALAITGVHHAAGSSCDIGGFHLASAADLVLFDIESQPVTNLGLAVQAVLDMKEDVAALKLDKAPALDTVEGLDQALAASLGFGLVALPLALALALDGHVTRIAAASHILGLLLTLPDIVLLNVKLHSVTRCWPAILTVLDVDEDILPLVGDEAPALQ